MPIADRLSRYAPVLLGLLRIVAGLLFLSHGLVKLFGFPPGAQPGPQQLLTLFGIGGLVELVTGSLIALGLLTRPAAFLASGEMAVGYWMYHAPTAFYPAVNGGDAAILYCFLFLYLAAAGPGALSLDGAMAGRKARTDSPRSP
ncbi:MAG: putative oxidoreductase [Sphingomonadales bacterium]|jgi:putative oxidoreductase|nr:putative oxidoreductase [Sphingomonadales bacterium]